MLQNIIHQVTTKLNNMNTYSRDIKTITFLNYYVEPPTGEGVLRYDKYTLSCIPTNLFLYVEYSNI